MLRERVDVSSTALVPPRQPPKRSNPLQIVNSRNWSVLFAQKDKYSRTQTTRSGSGIYGSVLRAALLSRKPHAPYGIHHVGSGAPAARGGVSYSSYYETSRRHTLFVVFDTTLVVHEL